MSRNSTLRGKAFRGPKVPLPMTAAFNRDDIVITGRLLTLVKRKGFLFNCYSAVAFRNVTILRNGMLLVYDNDRAGWTLDMKQMLRMKTTTAHSQKDNLRRLQLELKTTRGAVSMVAIGTDATRWMDALSGVLKETGEEAPLVEAGGKLSTVTLFEEDGVISPLNDEPEEEDKCDDNISMKSQKSHSTAPSRSTTYSVLLTYQEPKSIVVPPDSSASDAPKKMAVRSVAMPESVHRKLVSRTAPRPVSPLPPTAGSPTDSSATESVRHGACSVATLRQMLEARTRVSIRKARSSRKSTAGVPTAVMVAEEKKVVQEEEKSRNKKSSLRCRPSKSAPAAVAVPEGKKIIVGNYNGCFDSSLA